MYRYVALFWNGLSNQERERAKRVLTDIETAIPAMSCVLTGNGAAIYAQSDDPAFFEVELSPDLVIVGKLFEKEFGTGVAPKRAVLDSASARAVCSTQGRTLVERYWGRYVSFGYDEAVRSWFAVRDPTAEIPCYVTVVEGMTVVFSNMEDCLRLRLQDYTVDWSYLAYSLRSPFRDATQTGFKEVMSVEAGEALTIKDGRPVARRCHWDIVTAGATEPISDLGEAVRLARSTILGCIGALASQHAQIELQLSGGLDSSIVLAGLLHAPSQPEVQCIHHYSAGIGADERPFAKMAVDGARRSSGRNCTFVEHERTPDLPLGEILTLPRTARPLHGFGYLAHRHAWLESASGGDAVHFTGGGGDGIFWRFKGNAPAIDYAWHHGIDRRLCRIALETAQSGASFYGVMRDAIRYGVFKRPAHKKGGWGSPCEWLQPVHPAEEEKQPAFMREARLQQHCLSPQKMAHIARMVFPFSILDPFEGASRWRGVAPISAQPVAELFARIPLHLLMAGAEDRTIARRAFDGLLPQPLLGRRVKSYMDDHAIAVVDRHREFIRAMLADGILAKHGLIDGAAADTGIRRLSPNNASQLLAVTGPLLNIEAWLRRSFDRPQLRADKARNVAPDTRRA